MWPGVTVRSDGSVPMARNSLRINRLLLRCGFTPLPAVVLLARQPICQRLYVISGVPQFTVSAIAGTGTAGFWGDSRPALKAKLNNPFGVVSHTRTGSRIFFVDGCKAGVKLSLQWRSVAFRNDPRLHWPPTCFNPTMRNRAKYLACTAALLCAVKADPVPVRHRQGYIHGFLVLKDTNDKILASGDLIQLPSGNRVTDSLSLRFADGIALRGKISILQSHADRLLTYKQVMKGASFKTQEVLSLDTSSGA